MCRTHSGGKSIGGLGGMRGVLVDHNGGRKAPLPSSSSARPSTSRLKHSFNHSNLSFDGSAVWRNFLKVIIVVLSPEKSGRNWPDQC